MLLPKATNMTPRCICIKMAAMDKKQGAPTEKGLPRHAPAAMRVTHTTIQRQLGHHLSSQHPLFDGPFSEEAVARTSANLPEWNSPSVHRPPPPPCPPCHPSIHLKCNFKIFSTTPSAVRIAFGRIPLKLQTNPSPLSEHSLHARNCILGSGCGCDSGHCDSGSVCSNSGSTNALPRPADGAQDSGLTQKLAQSH